MQAIKRRALLLLVALCCVLSAASASGAITVTVNGSALPANATIVNGSVMLPFRTVFHALGVTDGQIKWNAAQRSIEVRTSDERYLFLVVGSQGALVNEKMLTLPVAPFIQNGSTYVPVRVVAEALGASVQWKAASRTVAIVK